MRYLYYPGCTLYDKAKNMDASGRASAKALGVDLEEMPNWTCCGTTYPLSDRKLIGLVAPVRTLVRAKRAGNDELLTLCSFCFNVLKRANHAMASDGDVRKRVNAYLDDEFRREGDEYEEYTGEVKTVHLLEVLRDRMGFEEVKAKTKRPLAGLKVAPYYGCLLLRPAKEMQFDDVEHPTVLENLLTAIGCEVVDFPAKVECCGSYLGVSAPDVALDCSYQIVSAAKRFGADVLALACPLCAYNLDHRQEGMAEKHKDYGQVPVLYFTQLLGLAMEVGETECFFDRHAVDPRPLLREKGLL